MNDVTAPVGQPFVPERFRREVILHLFKNLDPAPEPGVPLILGIHGPSGEGKTYQCFQVLTELAAHVEFISGGELESADAGEPAQLIRRRYVSCGARRTTAPHGVTALVINDIDAAVGNWGDHVQYTVNRQHVFGELMHLADFPDRVQGGMAQRVPIIVTGNNFSQLYGPVIRPGRMRSFTWQPEHTEKAAILARAFGDLTEHECWQLVERFPDQPLSFFTQARSQMLDDRLWALIRDHGLQYSFQQLATGHRPRISCPVDLSSMVDACERSLSGHRFVDHLAR